jgi:hypothetical protein
MTHPTFNIRNDGHGLSCSCSHFLVKKTEREQSRILGNSDKSLKSFLPCYSQSPLLYSVAYFFKHTQPLTVSAAQLLYPVKEKGIKPDRKPYPLPYGLGNPYRNLKSETSASELVLHSFHRGSTDLWNVSISNKSKRVGLYFHLSSWERDIVPQYEYYLSLCLPGRSGETESGQNPTHRSFKQFNDKQDGHLILSYRGLQRQLFTIS